MKSNLIKIPLTSYNTYLASDTLLHKISALPPQNNKYRQVLKDFGENGKN
jgi:hypothetical protein